MWFSRAGPLQLIDSSDIKDTFVQKRYSFLFCNTQTTNAPLRVACGQTSRDGRVAGPDHANDGLSVDAAALIFQIMAKLDNELVMHASKTHLLALS